MSTRFPWDWLLASVFVGTGIYVAEVLACLWFGQPFPLPLWYFTASLVLVVSISLAAGLLFCVLELTGSSWYGVLVLLPWAAALVKLGWVGGTGSAWPYLALCVPFLTVLILGPRAREGPPGFHWLLVSLLVVLLSTDVYQVFWVSVSEGGIPGWSIAFGVWVVGFPIMRAGALTRPLPAWIRRNLVLVLTGALVVLLAVLLSWSNQANPPWWDRESYYVGRRAQPELADTFTRSSAPNVILISVDGLDAGVLEPDRLEDLPHLRSLKRDGIRFRKTFSTSSWMLPGQASLFTGRLPHHHRAVSRFFSRLPATMKTYPLYLQQAGYRTMAFTGGGFAGRQHGFGRGFDRYHQQPHPHTGYVPGGIEYFSTLLADSRYRFPFRLRDHDPPPARQFEPVLDGARDVLERMQSDTEPSFLFLQTHEVRDYRRGPPSRFRRLQREAPRLARALESPDLPPLPDPVPSTEQRRQFLTREASFSDTDWNRFRSRIGDFEAEDWERTLLGYSVQLLPPVPLRQLKGHIATMESRDWRDFMELTQDEVNYFVEWNRQALRRLRGLTPSKLRAREQLHRYAAESVDERLGEWLRTLKRHGLYEDSLIVLVSSHGEGFSRDPLIVGRGVRVDLDRHGQVHDRLVNVPLLVKLPGNRGGGQSYGGILQITDVFPLLFRYLGINPKDPEMLAEDLDVTLRSVVEGNPPAGRSTAVGSVESGNHLEPKFFVRGDHFKYTLDAGWKLEEYWSVPERSHEDFLAPGQVDEERRRRLRKRMSVHLLDFYRPPHAYSGLRAESRRYLSRHIRLNR